MSMQSYQARRLWKLRAVKAFTLRETRAFPEIRKIVGDRRLDALFNEGFDQHPRDPELGAAFVQLNLHQRYGVDLQTVLEGGNSGKG